MRVLPIDSLSYATTSRESQGECACLRIISSLGTVRYILKENHMVEELFIPVVLGTIREGRESERVARYIFEKVQQIEGIRTELVDIADLSFPARGEGTALRDANPQFRDTMTAADGYLMVVPEYNHSFPGSFKRAIDTLEQEYCHKAVGVCSVSSGIVGGARMVESLLPIWRTLCLSPIKPDLYIRSVEDAFDEQGVMKDPYFEKAFKKFMDELTWMTKTLKAGRQAV